MRLLKIQEALKQKNIIFWTDMLWSQTIWRCAETLF